MINILYCGNDGVFDGMLSCSLSILKRSDNQEPITFYVFTMDVSHLRDDYVPISDKKIEFFEKVIKKYNSENRAIKIDVTELYKKEFDKCPNEGTYCSPYTLIRLFADMVDLPSKVLYLDVDLLFNRDIHLLYDMDIEGYEYLAARDHYGKFLINPNYINAGVLLFNLEMMKKTNLLGKARQLIKTKKLTFADQSAIIRSTTKRKVISQRFNDQKILRKKTIIRHFSKRLFWLPYPHTDNIKQWQVNRVHKVFGYHCFDDILEEYESLKAEFEREYQND
ncbi:MAG: lipopolysaccharide biosynthesis protein [Clostridia bacterium]|nr:lipopolysaccharide biosynthesis protein [Clostridia bacterium]